MKGVCRSYGGGTVGEYAPDGGCYLRDEGACSTCIIKDELGYEEVEARHGSRKNPCRWVKGATSIKRLDAVGGEGGRAR